MPKRNFAIAILVTISLAFIYGIGVAAFSLREPDTCFLLSMGRWICQHKMLPVTDPFSYTFAMYSAPQGLVVYQWLTEVIFFAIITVAGTMGLVTFACSILVYSLIIMPWRILECFKLGSLRAGLITIGVALGSIERMLLKPEIFSYLFLAVYLEIVVRQEMRTDSHRINWKLATVLAVIMVLWANLHSGFVIGILLLLVLSLRDLCGNRRALLTTWSISFVFCLLASLITPYGILLWQYIPHLYFHPANRYIGELQPFTTTLASHNLPLLCSFGGLSLLALFRIRRGFRPALTGSDFIYMLIAIVGMVLGILFQRLITFGLLLMLPLIGSGFHIKTETPAGTKQKNIHALIVLSAIAGSLSMLLFSHPTIPAISRVFVPPFQALDYIAVHNPSGNLFNDPEFGDVLMWNGKNPVKLFIDTRFDIYSQQTVRDYLAIADCNPTWRELLIKYKINWIFLSPATRLCQYLEKDAAWQVAFKNEQAEIIVHHRSMKQ